MSPPLPLEPKPRLPAAYHEHDPRAFDVARLLCDAITAAWPGAAPEHIGSSSVPGLPGKGYVDLQLPADPADIPAIPEALVAIGLHRQTNRDPFPPTRPMLEGALRHDGTLFILHVHIIPAGEPEIQAARAFRDALRRDPALREAYAAEKRRIIAEGITDGVDYAVAKGHFVEDVLRRLGLLPSP